MFHFANTIIAISTVHIFFLRFILLRCVWLFIENEIYENFKYTFEKKENKFKINENSDFIKIPYSPHTQHRLRIAYTIHNSMIHMEYSFTFIIKFLLFPFVSLFLIFIHFVFIWLVASEKNTFARARWKCVSIKKKFI